MNRWKRVPKHIGIIPDGNRRWADSQGLNKEDGYSHGIDPGFQLFQECQNLGIEELTFYGFTQDNTKRPMAQTKAFVNACVDSVVRLTKYDASLLVVGNINSTVFPKELLPYTKRVSFGKATIKVNFLVNYGWDWDLNYGKQQEKYMEIKKKEDIIQGIASSDISRMDLIIRWGGMRRLSGFLPVQSVYSDFYIIDELWPDFAMDQFYGALDWYQMQDVTLGG